MDIEIQSDRAFVEKTLQERGFALQHKSGYTSAFSKTETGRDHILIRAAGDTVFCDLHHDNRVHLLFLGVDYKNRPRQVFKEVLQPVFDAHQVRYQTYEVNWFNRRNRALLTGYGV